MSNETTDFDAIRNAHPRLATLSDPQVDRLLFLLISPQMDFIVESLARDRKATEFILQIATHPAVRKEAVRFKQTLAGWAARLVTVSANAVRQLEALAVDPRVSDSTRQDVKIHLAYIQAVKTIREELEPFTKDQRKEILKTLSR